MGNKNLSKTYLFGSYTRIAYTTFRHHSSARMRETRIGLNTVRIVDNIPRLILSKRRPLDIGCFKTSMSLNCTA